MRFGEDVVREERRERGVCGEGCGELGGGGDGVMSWGMGKIENGELRIGIVGMKGSGRGGGNGRRGLLKRVGMGFVERYEGGGVV